MQLCMLFDDHGNTLYTPGGHSIQYLPPIPGYTVIEVAPGCYAQRITAEHKPAGLWQRPHTPKALRALAIVHNQERQQFSATSGLALQYHDPMVATTDTGEIIFPRIDPAVIGLIRDPDNQRIMLAKNRLRNSYYSLIAGYVELGETFEEAMAREAWEETGRRLDNITYIASQPWPFSGSVMVGMAATTTDEYAQTETDDELEEIIWVDRGQMADIALPPRFSIAYRLIKSWVKGEII
ncbi:NAD(+) diphosphatase [Corynebacterium kutscheri]|uniref:NAD(+) diphosphatase n=1 Tax=Corynebacterium kutscheri TaxID=35755 RepID=UPI0037C19CB0